MGPKLKIMHIAECAGGVDRYLEMLLPLLKEKYEQVFVCSQNFDAKKYHGLVNRVYQIEMRQTLSPFRVAAEVMKLRRLITKRLNVKVTYNPHGWAFNQPYGIKPKVYRLLERGLSDLTDVIIAISEFEKKNALLYKIAPENKIKVILSGVDIKKTIADSKEQSVRRESMSIPEDAYVVGMTARICETKAPDTFVKAATIIKTIIPNAYFLLIGDGDMRKDIEHLIKREGLGECTVITGWVNNPLPYVKLLDLGMLVSRWEGFGFALVEYMLLEKPIVATCVGAIPELVEDGKNGLLAKMDDYVAIADKVVEIFRSKDLQNRLTICAKNHAIVEYDIRRVANQHIELFDKLGGVIS